MKTKILYLVLILMFSFLSEIFANNTFKLLDAKYQAGEITYNQMMMNKFYYVFDKSKLDTRFNLNETTPIKSATILIKNFYQNKEKFTESEIKEVEKFLNAPWENKSTMAVYNSPGGKFQLTYYTTGTNAVPTADNNGNGVPDYVEWVASYFDYCWAFEIDSLGFLAPPIGSGKYQIGFENMSAYGYTTPVGGTLTRIVMHSNFSGFPPNQDPEGNQKGAAKVTAAHEFKHATQINYNYWSDPDWFLEIDATWMEDIAYDYVNDYYNYINYTGSPFTSPGQSLDAGDGYEDCVWMHYLSEKNGVLFNRRLWERRSNNGEDIFASHNFVLTNFYSSDFQTAFKEFGMWNSVTGTRAITGYGYGEASSYITSSLCRTVTSFPTTFTNCSITKYSNNFIRINPISNTNYININFNGVNGGPYFRAGIIIRKTNGTFLTSEIQLDANNDGSYTASLPNNQISFIMLSVSSVTNFTAPTFSVTVTEQSLNSANISINTGWNLLSMPLNATSMEFSTIFPEAISQAYVFNNGTYTQATTAEVGKAFWIKFPSETTKSVSGTPLTNISIPVTAGWNMIGPLGTEIQASAITSNPAGIIASSFYEFNNGYFPVTSLKPGKGYWVKVSANGQIIIQ